MNDMKKLFSIFAMLAAAAAVSCGNTEDPADNPNDNPGGKEPETAAITFDGGETPAPVIAAGGGQATVGFTSALEWTVDKDPAIEWLTASPVSGSGGHAQITLTATANEDYDERNAAVTIVSGDLRRSVTVTQKQKDALTLTSNKVEMPSDGGEFTIEFATNAADAQYEIESSAGSWITEVAADQTRGVEDRSLTFAVAENTAESSREGKIVLKAGELTETVTVYQSALQPRLIVSNDTYTVAAGGGVLKIELQSNTGEVAVTAPDLSWIREQKSRAMSSYTFNF